MGYKSPRTCSSKYDCTCDETGKRIRKGETFYYEPHTLGIYHLESQKAKSFLQSQKVTQKGSKRKLEELDCVTTLDGHTYSFIDDEDEISHILDRCGVENDEVTAIVVLAGDAEYLEVWTTFYDQPWLLLTDYTLMYKAA